ncbi:hypothetical protein ACFSTC_41155 [Nonomuraea ferruginea]
MSVDQDGALAAAREADAELAGGADRGPLHGLPVGGSRTCSWWRACPPPWARGTSRGTSPTPTRRA